MTTPTSPVLRLIHSSTPPDDFLKHQALGGDFYRAAGSAEVPGFTFGFFSAMRGDQRVAVVPYFVTLFQLNTMLDDGWLKRHTAWLGLRIACIGHPCAPLGYIDPPEGVSAELLDLVYAELRQRAPVVAMKGFGPDMPANGFVRVKGLPVALLKLRPHFWDTMTSHRRNLRRKRKAASALRFEVVDGLPADLVDTVYSLYLQSWAKANVVFERLSRAYFVSTAALSRYLLTRLEGKVVGFVQLIQKDHHMAAFYMGIDYSVDSKHGIYFAQAMQAVDVALASGCAEIELGETSYAFKRSLGCDLLPTWVYYRHRNPLANWILARLAFMLEPSAKELA